MDPNPFDEITSKVAVRWLLEVRNGNIGNAKMLADSRGVFNLRTSVHSADYLDAAQSTRDCFNYIGLS